MSIMEPKYIIRVVMDTIILLTGKASIHCLGSDGCGGMVTSRREGGTMPISINKSVQVTGRRGMHGHGVGVGVGAAVTRDTCLQ